MLEKEGFTRSGLVDIFDGGPTVTCARDSIRTIRKSRKLGVSVGVIESNAPVCDMLVSTGSMSAFRTIRTNVVLDQDNVVLPADSADLLRLSEGDPVQVSPYS
mgnify:FL=1